jgi:predicted kinase
MPHVINPDDYLQTEAGRVFTEERSAAAWERMYAEIETAFRNANSETRFYLVMGVQGSGKSTWIRKNLAALEPSAVVLDAALPARRHRARTMALVARYDIHAVAVWIKVSLERALVQNTMRPADEIVPEFAVRSVFSFLEEPLKDEGFASVLQIDSPE